MGALSLIHLEDTASVHRTKSQSYRLATAQAECMATHDRSVTGQPAAEVNKLQPVSPRLAWDHMTMHNGSYPRQLAAGGGRIVKHG